MTLKAMTALMRERADLALRLFQRTPHPGMDDLDPEYEFDVPVRKEQAGP